MRVEQALRRFRALCADAGLDAARLEPRKAWNAFVAFLREPVDVAIDGASFQCGPASDDESEVGAFAAFVRVFSDAAAEEDDEELLEGIVAELDFAGGRTPLDAIEVHSHEFESLDDFVRHVESLPQFRAVMEMETLGSEIYAQEL